MTNLTRYKQVEVTVLQSKLGEKWKDNADRNSREWNKRFNESEIKIKELTSKIAEVKETLQNEKQVLNCKFDKLNKHADYTKVLQKEKNKFMLDIQTLEAKKNNFKMSKPNIQDQQLLERGWKKLNLYKRLTRIRWDYVALTESIKGYVSNGSNYVHHFYFKKGDNNIDVSNQLWNDIYLSTRHQTKEKEETIWKN